MVRLYGTRAWKIVGSAKGAADLGHVFGADLTEAEVAYLADNEWARAAEDVLWRRTKLGLKIDATGVAAIDAFLKTRPNAGVHVAAL